MADLLVRNIPEETKRQLALRATENGRSQSAEAVAILEASLQPEQKSWIRRLYEVSQEVGGVEFELPARQPARDFSFGEA